jgi:hypothetical protein
MAKKTFHVLEKGSHLYLSLAETSKHSTNINAFIQIELENEHPDTLFKAMINNIKDFPSVHDAVVSLDGKRVINKIIELPVQIAKDIDKYYYYECLKYFKFQSDKFIFSYSILKQNDTHAKVQLIGVEKEVIERYSLVFEKLEIDISYTVSNFNSIEGFDTKRLKEDIILIEFFKDVNLSAYSDNNIIFVRSFEQNSTSMNRIISEIERIKSYVNSNYGDFAPSIFVFGEDAMDFIKYCEDNNKTGIRVSYYDIYDPKLYKVRYGIKKGADQYTEKDYIHLYHTCAALKAKIFNFLLPEDAEKQKNKDKTLFTKVNKYFLSAIVMIFVFISVFRILSRYYELSNVLDEEVIYTKKISEMDNIHGVGFSMIAPMLAKKVFTLNRISRGYHPNFYILNILSNANKDGLIKLKKCRIKNGSICLLEGTGTSEQSIKKYKELLETVKGIKINRFKTETEENSATFRMIIKLSKRIVIR